MNDNATTSSPFFQNMSLEDIVSNRESILRHLEQAKEMLEAMNGEIIRRAAEKKATVLFSKHHQIEVTRTEKIFHRFDVLRRLKGMIPDEAFDRAIYLEQPEPQWKADTVKLKSYGKKFGEDVAAVIKEGMVYEAVGLPKIKIIERFQNAESLAA